MNWWEWIIILLGGLFLIVVVIPFTFFLTAKLIAYGVLSGRHRFEQDQEQRRREQHRGPS